MTSHSDRTSGFLFSLPGTNRLCCLERPEDIPPGHRTSFPYHNGRSTEELLAETIAAIRKDLEAGLEMYMRVTTYTGKHPHWMAQRSWAILDAIGREIRMEPVDLVPISYLDAVQWPATPRSTTAAQRRARAV